MHLQRAHLLWKRSLLWLGARDRDLHPATYYRYTLSLIYSVNLLYPVAREHDIHPALPRLYARGRVRARRQEESGE